MGKKIVRFSADNIHQWGVVYSDRVYPLSGSYNTLAELLVNGVEDIDQANSGNDLALSDLKLLSPVTDDAKLICQGLNYAQHREESAHTTHEDDDFLHFGKDSSSLSGAFDDIVRPKDCRLLDYEAELGLVLGKAIDAPVDIAESQVGEYVAGLVVCNDVSARDLMFGASFLQWYKGKSQRSFCPTGPFLYLLDKDETEIIYDLDVILSVNGDVRQRANTEQLIHRPAKVLSELSQQLNLKVGDLLLTGTPGGVIAQSTPASFKALTTLLVKDRERREAFTEDQLQHARFLEPDDEVRVSIKSTDGSVDLGEQITKVVDY